MTEKDTTISIKPSTKGLLSTLGKKNESFDKIIRRLVELDRSTKPASPMNTATVDKHGHVYVGRKLAGKEIEYRFK